MATTEAAAYTCRRDEGCGVRTMTKVVLPSSVASDLFACTTRTPLCDEDGVVIGFFEPAISHDKELYDWLAKEVTTEELEEAARDGGGITTAELFAKLEALAKAKDNAASSVKPRA
jgi:hypothetical protein